MCGPARAVGAPPPQPTQKLELDIVGACSGELCSRVLAAPEWTVRHLKLELARKAGGAAANQHLFVAGQPLADGEVLGSVLLRGPGNQTLALLRTELPKREPAQVAGDFSRNVTVDADGHGSWGIRWRVDARMLRKAAKHVTARPFELSFGPGLERVVFNLTICAADDGPFRKVRGRGHVQLKCMSDIPVSMGEVTYSILVGSGKGEGQLHGPFPHNFALNAATRPPTAEDMFDFSAAANASGGVNISVDVVHVRPPA